MSRFRVHMQQVASTAVTVEAEDRDDAIEKAYNAAPSGLCAHCAGFGQQPGIDLAGGWEIANEDEDVVEDDS